jgi:hypothetical protein
MTTEKCYTKFSFLKILDCKNLFSRNKSIFTGKFVASASGANGKERFITAILVTNIPFAWTRHLHITPRLRRIKKSQWQ